MPDTKRLIAYGASAQGSGYSDAATACSINTGGTQLLEEPGTGAVFVYAQDGDAGHEVYLVKVALPVGPGDFYTNLDGFVAGQKVYVTTQDLEGVYGEITNAGWYTISLDAGFANAVYITTLESEDQVYQPTACAASTEEINFTTGSYAPNYVTSSTTPIEAVFTYGVIRTDASAAPLNVEIDISGGVAGYAVEGIDYDRPANSELTLSWASETDGTETFDVAFLVNPAYTASTFIPYIRSSSIASIVGTASYADTEIIYPGTLDFTVTGSEINEGQAQVVTINRSSGSGGQLTATLLLAGTAVEDQEYTFTNLVQAGLYATAVFEDDDEDYSFTINALQDTALTSSTTLNFTIYSLGYPLSGTQNYPEASTGTGSTYAFIINNYDTGSLMMSGSGYNIYTASMPITWSVERYNGSDGAVTAIIDLAPSGGYATGAFLTDYTSAYGAFPVTFTWGDGNDDPETFSLLTMDNDGTAVSISPYISSASVVVSGTTVTSSAAWITYPGSTYLTTLGETQVVEGGDYFLYYSRSGYGTVGELTATLSFTGSAVSGTDYTFIGSNLPDYDTAQIALGGSNPTSLQLNVQTTDDSIDEDDETITIFLNETSGTIYKFFTDGNDYGPAEHAAFAFDTGSLFVNSESEPTSSTVTIIDNETGSVDFSAASQSLTQNSSIIVSVTRGPEGDFAATATIDQYSGAAVQGRDYTGLPVSLYWDDQETGTKTFTITTISPWATASTDYLGMHFLTLVNLDTGTGIPTEELIITNTIYSEEANPYPEIASDFTINTFKNMSTEYRRLTNQVPFSRAIRGPSTIRKINTPYSTSLGKTS